MLAWEPVTTIGNSLKHIRHKSTGANLSFKSLVLELLKSHGYVRSAKPYLYCHNVDHARALTWYSAGGRAAKDMTKMLVRARITIMILGPASVIPYTDSQILRSCSEAWQIITWRWSDIPQNDAWCSITNAFMKNLSYAKYHLRQGKRQVRTNETMSKKNS